MGEKYENCIRREIKEEINLNIKVVKKIVSVNYSMIGLTKKETLIIMSVSQKTFQT